MLGRTNDSAGRFLTDCVEVAYRLPRLWAAVQAGLVAGWRARLIAQTTLALTLEAATYVDEQVFWCASRLTPAALGRLVDEARVRFMPDEVEQALERSADKRHVTFDTQQVSFDGTMAMEASLELPDALALAEAVKSGAEHLAKLGSTDTIDGRRATALGDLARHQLTIGFDDPADDDASMVRGGPRSPSRNQPPPRSPSPRSCSTPTCPPTPSPTPTPPRVPPAPAWHSWPGRAGRPTVVVGGADPRLVRPPRRRRDREPGDRPARAARVPGLRAHREDPRARDRPRRHVRVPVVRTQRPRLRRRPHRPLRPRPSRPGRPDVDRQPRRAVPAPPPVEDPRPLALRDDRPRRLRLDQPARLTYLRDHTGSRATGTRLARARGLDPSRRPTRLLRTALRSTTRARHTRPTTDHHAPDPAPVTPAGS